MQVEAFLQRTPSFRLLPLEEAWPLTPPPPSPGPYLTLTPLRHQTDGFFAAVLERTENKPSPSGRGQGEGGTP